MPHREPTIRSRELGDGLRQAMEAAGLTGKQAAAILSWSPSFFSMLLTEKRQVSEVDIAAFLGCAGSRARNVTGCWRCAGIRTPQAGSSSTAPGCPSS
jgi:hypothetical protein